MVDIPLFRCVEQAKGKESILVLLIFIIVSHFT